MLKEDSLHDDCLSIVPLDVQKYFSKDSVSVFKQNKFSIYLLRDTHFILSFIIDNFIEPLFLNIFSNRVITYAKHN